MTTKLGERGDKASGAAPSGQSVRRFVVVLKCKRPPVGDHDEPTVTSEQLVKQRGTAV
jgi:hypothetical protein